LCDIGGLLLNGNQNVASLVVETFLGIIVANILDRISDNFLVIELSLGSNLTKDHNHTSLGGGLASNLGKRILPQAGVEDGIRDLISDLIWVALSYRLRLDLWLVVWAAILGEDNLR